MEFIQQKGLTIHSKPHKWFNVFCPRRILKTRGQHSFCVGDWCRWTNSRAVLLNAGPGGIMYQDFKPFAVDELYKYIGVYFLNGVSLLPQVEMNFRP
mmetsp:Transcript_45772/g.89440  ORF Transcript_45772/g.89440 Transcript_45772/m.89440 type:complete len:97 (-) Transcript_45772:495-785(-)